jgi:3D (Asp-Asp-Asp) domain-containing protein
MNKLKLSHSILIAFMSLVVVFGTFTPETINADSEILAEIVSSTKITKTIKMVVTAYSSTPEETDSTPFITASGKHVTDGIIANNMLPFGTKVRIPNLYGNKVFVVEDRMHKRKGVYHVDIWFKDQGEAKEFGATLASIEVLES